MKRIFCKGESEELQRLGNVLHVSSSRNLILRTKITPKIGLKVVDENLNPIGKVLEVFGPVPTPYVSVKPSNPKSDTKIGSILYTVPSSKKRKEKRRSER
jgi:rRNA processing protein Gar1